MNDESKPNGYRVTMKQMREFLIDPDWVKDTTLIWPLRAVSAYRHPDGRILVEYPSMGAMYASQQEVDRALEILEQGWTQKPQHILSGRFPYSEDFPSQIPMLVADLSTMLKIPSPELDFSWASLEKVEKKIKHRGRQKSLALPIFPALLAYVGEVMRHDVQGEWQMRRSRQDAEVWEPWIVDAREHEYNPFLPLYDALDEDSDYPTIQIVIAATVEVSVKRVWLPPHKRKPGPFPISGDDPPPKMQK